ncbi:TolC family protein [Reichenbachiella agarivorans]|uniref:TolC family protein n=1 Tax=Reichenbachiella agarivorans TaxID=2979464 RepID=A0ABY6CSF2_9BACT|nr:TolC family protein [Reichenbachiella agarivorans]UXP33447.1 TolC family protein [Reichenbachiella agarivorans]
MRSKLVILTLVMALAIPTQAQKVYSLMECVKRAQEENLEVSNSQYDQLLYDQQVKEVKRSALPQVGFGAEYKIYTQLPTTVIPLSAFQPGEEGYSEAAFGTDHQSNYSLHLEQVIFNPTLFVGIKAANTAAQMGELQYKQTKENITYQVASNYFNAQVIAEQISMLKENSRTLDTLINSTRLMQESGLVNHTDVSRLKINQSKLDNQIATLSANYDYVLNSLRLLLNLSADAEFAVVTDFNPTPTPLESNEAFDYQDRTELQLLDKQKEVLHLQEKQIQAGYLPNISAVGTYGFMGFGQPDQDFYEHYDFSYVGLKASWLLFDGFTKTAQTAQKRIEQKQLESSMELTRRSIENERINALSKLRVHHQEVINQKQSMELASQVYNDIKLQYSEGVVGVQEIIESENELTESQTNYLNSWVHLQQAKLDLAKAEGALLNDY